MSNPLNVVKDIVKSVGDVLEPVGKTANDIVEASLSGQYVKRPDETDEAYQARLELLGKKEDAKLRRQELRSEDREKRRIAKSETQLRRQELKAEAQEKQRERKHIRQMQKQEARLLKQEQRAERKSSK